MLALKIIQGNATLGNPELESKTLVLLAGGKASRLNEFLKTNDHVKCLSRFGEKIFIDYLLNQAEEAGIERVVILGGPQREEIQRAVRALSHRLEFFYPEEKVRLGTGGALKLVKPYLNEERFILSNADTYFERNPFQFVLTKASETKSPLFLMGTSRGSSDGKFISKDVAMKWPDLYQTGDYIYAGVSVLNSNIIENWHLPDICSYEKDVFAKLKNGAEFISCPFSEVDFGTGAGFKNLQNIFKKEVV